MTTPEIQPKTSSFRMENTYDAHAVYSLLTRDYKEHTYTFENNWGDVVASYDPVQSIDAKVNAFTLAEYRKSALRDQKTFVFRGEFSSGDQYRYLIQVKGVEGFGITEEIGKFQEELYRHGVDVDFVREDRYRRDHLVVRNTPLPAEIYFSNSSISIIYPEEGWHQVPGTQMNTPEEFAAHFATFFDLLEKTLKATYSAKEKQLPLNNLVFVEPTPVTNKESSTEFLTKCSYCNTPYMMTPQILNCPSCGAPPKTPSNS